MPKIIIAESEKSIRSILELISIERMGLAAKTTQDANELLEYINSASFASTDLILLDSSIDDNSGLDILREIRARKSDTLIIMMHYEVDSDFICKARNYGAYDFLQKPIDIERFKISVENALKIKKLYNQIQSFSNLLSNQQLSCSMGDNRPCVDLLDKNGILKRFQDLEMDIIAKALEIHRGRISEVARKLGIGRSTIYRKIDSLKINHDDGNTAILESA